MANLSYYGIRETCLLVSCDYKLAGKVELFVEHYVGKQHEYFALFFSKPNSLLPLTITQNELY